MQFVADFHIHSKYSRATSREMDIEHLAKWAKIKGISLLGTGDFTHHLWLEELKANLEPKDNGLFVYNGINFILTAEISSIYSKKGRTYRIHNCLLAPSFETVDKINARLSEIGNLASDGRPILGLDAKELVRIVLDIDPNCMIIPAHCLLPDSHIHTKLGIKKIKDIQEGELVYTHKSNIKKVTKTFKRQYKGEIYHIKPFYFREGLKTTPEHPFYVIKTYKNCPSTQGYCKKDCCHIKKGCKRRFYEDYKPGWVQAKDIENSDVLLFPRFINNSRDINEIKLSDYIEADFTLKNNKIAPNGSRVHWLPNNIKIDEDFCRLVGYYLAEGYTNNRDQISFCFKDSELDYINDVKFLVKKIFDINLSSNRIREGVNSIELNFCSKILLNLFSKFFYVSNPAKTHNKCLPGWMLQLSAVKQMQILKGWWRGDTGYTSSQTLMNQMKIILLRLGIIPSIRVDSIQDHFKRGKHKIGERDVVAKYDNYYFSNLSFFEDEHSLLNDPSFEKFRTKLQRRHGWMDDKYIYIPVKDIEVSNYNGEVYNLEVEDDNSYVSEFAIVHNCWTPWFSLFGSMSGFDKIEYCFEEQTKNIFCLETGLSSDPAMNWRLSALDRFSLISNSDSHSPSRIGREANVFDCGLDYKTIMEVLKTKDKKRFLYTIEFFPQEGKYHFDGHRNCGICFSPQESRKHKNRCPKCGRALTIGVMNRVEQLADRPVGFVPENNIPFKNLIPLDEIISEVRGVGKASKTVTNEYNTIIHKFQTEFDVLVKATREELAKSLPEKIVEGIMRVRQGRVDILPGHDGEYGKIKIFDENEKGKPTGEEQLSLF
ncbi:MAG: hypothetical protein KJ593_00305 [Candidatus Omnitrophica bacterium]|nr:hypothetical protein [Candidatus Omnitrophota bacterium]